RSKTKRNMTNMKMRRRRLECEHLETRALLSGSSGHISAQLRHHVMTTVSKPVAAPAAQVETAQSVINGALVNAPSDADVTALPDTASDNTLVLFLTQFEALSGSDASLQQTALSILNDSRDIDLALNTFAGGVAVTLPANVAGTNQALAQQMIAAVRSGNADQ